MDIIITQNIDMSKERETDAQSYGLQKNLFIYNSYKRRIVVFTAVQIYNLYVFLRINDKLR